MAPTAVAPVAPAVHQASTAGWAAVTAAQTPAATQPPERTATPVRTGGQARKTVVVTVRVAPASPARPSGSSSPADRTQEAGRTRASTGRGQVISTAVSAPEMFQWPRSASRNAAWCARTCRAGGRCAASRGKTTAAVAVATCSGTRVSTRSAWYGARTAEPPTTAVATTTSEVSSRHSTTCSRATDAVRRPDPAGTGRSGSAALRWRPNRSPRMVTRPAVPARPAATAVPPTAPAAPQPAPRAARTRAARATVSASCSAASMPNRPSPCRYPAPAEFHQMSAHPVAVAASRPAAA